MNDNIDFHRKRDARISAMQSDRAMRNASIDWVARVSDHFWAYNFSWMGRPAIQFPTDAWALQEIIWEKKPDIIVETGVARGGSLLFYASMLALLDICQALGTESKTLPDNPRYVIGVEIDLHQDNRIFLEEHPLYRYIKLVDGSSTDRKTFDDVRKTIFPDARVMAVLDSNHTHDHVFRELTMYSDLVSLDQYMVVLDTIIELMPETMFSDRPWGVGNNPMTAVQEFLVGNSAFKRDEGIPAKLQISTAYGGFLHRIPPGPHQESLSST